MDPIFERATAYGVEWQYRDGLGQLRTASPEVLQRLLDGLAPSASVTRRWLPATAVLRADEARELRLASPAGQTLHWQIRSDHFDAKGEATSPTLSLPADLPHGLFRLYLQAADHSEEVVLLLPPARAHQGSSGAPQRMWALAVQLYSVHSGRNWGHGDFTDLAALIDTAADLGASAVGLNPLHALFDDRPAEPSPYFVNSRLFLDPLYIDLDAVPEFPGQGAIELGARIPLLRQGEMVDRTLVTQAKLDGLRLAYKKFCSGSAPDRRVAFEHFRQRCGAALWQFACFETLRRKFVGPWWQWPAAFREPGDEALAQLRQSDADEVGYYEFVQWLTHQQLERCAMRARQRGLPLGLYLDVAVGVRRDGFDAWCDQAAILPGVGIGAPPDMLNRSGQDWGLAAFNPLSVAQCEFRPFRKMLESSMQYAGAVRLDHILGLQRLFLVPDGMSAEHGVYIHCPLEALLAVTALMSVENQCIVVGEDLGTVPENFRQALAQWGVWSYQVMLFERTHDGNFSPPQSYRENAVVTFATHDLSTYAGWRGERDLAVKRALGFDPGETADERRRAFGVLDETLIQRGLSAHDFASVARHLADAPSRLLVISIEDVLGVIEQVNLPGTTDQHPNWKRRLPVPLEGLAEHPGVRALAQAMREAGRGTHAGGRSDA
ncbi:MAG: 4-alpha-glucanotransferase [Xanthobacteraceae bacterium]